MKDLLLRAFDEELSEDEGRALAELIRTDDEAALRYLELARDEALLAECVVTARAGRALAPAPRSRWAVAAAIFLAAVTLVLAPPPEPASSPTFPPGTGLRAEYFNRPDLSQPRLTRIDSFLDFRWNAGAPDPALSSGSWSARWTGTLRARTAGLHGFSVHSDDGCRLWIDERLVVDHWSEQTRTERSGGAYLAPDAAVSLRLEYFNKGGPGSLRLSWTEPGLPQRTVPPDVLFPAAPAGRGLRGEYFDTLEASTPSLTRVDPLVDFDWGLTGDNFRVRWSGSLAPRRSGPTMLTVVSDDGCRLWIDGRLVIDDWTVRGSEERSVTLDLDAGRRHALRLEYFDRVSTARCSLYWSDPEQPRELIPQPCLYPE
jgi:hypothetical protein